MTNVESYTNYAPGTSLIRRIDITESGIVVFLKGVGSQEVGDALKQFPPIPCTIDDGMLMIPHQASSLYSLALRLQKNALISILFFDRLMTGLTDSIMQLRLEKARTILRKAGNGGGRIRLKPSPPGIP